MFRGRFLIRGNTCSDDTKSTTTTTTTNTTTTTTTNNNNDTIYKPILITNTSLSFWGGIDPKSGRIIDTLHPLYNNNITNTIFCIPYTSGSCTTSQVVLELLYINILPNTIIVRNNDPLLCIGTIIAQEFFTDKIQNICNILCIGEKNFNTLLSLQQQYNNNNQQSLYGHVTSNGMVHIGTKSMTSTATINDTSTCSTIVPIVPLPKSTTTNSTNNDSSSENDDEHDDINVCIDGSLPSSSISSVSSFYTKEELLYLKNCTTLAQEKALHVLFRYSKLSNFIWNDTFNNNNKNNKTITESTNNTITTTNTKQYIPIEQVHIDGCTYIGQGGIDFVHLLLTKQYNGYVKVPTTLNSISTDIRYWYKYYNETNNDNNNNNDSNNTSNTTKEESHYDYIQNAITLSKAYVALGCQPTYTCAPYLLLQQQQTKQQQQAKQQQVDNNEEKNYNNDTNDIKIPTNTNLSYIDHPSNSIGNYINSKNHIQSILYQKDIAWGESNAVVYANSILGARTEKYADYLDLCCAITGIVPYIGVHQVINRQPTIIINGTELINTIQNLLQFQIEQNKNTNNATTTSTNIPIYIDIDMIFPILGHLCGTVSDGRLPILIGFENNIEFWNTIITYDHLKSFCAAFGTTGSSPLIHIAGITPEAKDNNIIQEYISNCTKMKYPNRTITTQELYKTFQKFNNHNTHENKNHNNSNEDIDSNVSKINLIALGNPHLSITECSTIARIIQQMNSINPTITTTTTTRTTTRTTTTMTTPVMDDVTSTTNIPIVTQTKAISSPSTSSTPSSNVPSKIPTTRIMGCISRSIYEQLDPLDKQIMIDFGIEFIYDTCWCMILNEPIIPHDNNAIILTNSGKYAHYGPGLTKRPFRFGSIYDCIYAAQYGYYPHRYTTNNITSIFQPQPQSQLQAVDQESISKNMSTISSISSNQVTYTSIQQIDPYLSFLIRPIYSSSKYETLPHSNIHNNNNTHNNYNTNNRFNTQVRHYSTIHQQQSFQSFSFLSTTIRIIQQQLLYHHHHHYHQSLQRKKIHIKQQQEQSFSFFCSSTFLLSKHTTKVVIHWLQRNRLRLLGRR